MDKLPFAVHKLLFFDCQKMHEYLGTVKRNTGGFGDGIYSGVRDGLIKKAKSEFPNGDAIILQLKSGSADKADVIKFK